MGDLSVARWSECERGNRYTADEVPVLSIEGKIYFRAIAASAGPTGHDALPCALVCSGRVFRSHHEVHDDKRSRLRSDARAGTWWEVEGRGEAISGRPGSKAGTSPDVHVVSWR